MYDALTAAGFKIPQENRGYGIPIIAPTYKSPLTANEWATRNVPGFTRIEGGTPQPGDVVIQKGSSNGHMGIVTSPCTSISVDSGQDKIIENEFGFRSGVTYVIQRPNT